MEVGPSAAPMMPMEAASAAEVDHRADADEQQQRQCFAGLDGCLEEPLDDALALADALDHLVEDAGARQVDEDGAEAHRQQQRRLIVLLDGEVDEREAHEVHHALLPRHGSKAVKQKAHKCNTLLYYRIGFGKRKRLLPSDGCKDVFGKSLAIS